jgi:hypothetical protein
MLAITDNYCINMSHVPISSHNKDEKDALHSNGLIHMQW